MKLTIVTDAKGNLVGAMKGHAPRPDTSHAPTGSHEFRAGLMAGPGQSLHEIDAPDDLNAIEEPEAFGKRVSALIREHKLGS
jgi:hypothetical protein